MKTLRLIARIWSIPLIIFVLIVMEGYTWSWATTGIADPYALPDTPVGEALPPIFISLRILGLALSWRWEKLGSLFALVFLAATLVTLFIQVPLNGLTLPRATPYFITLVVAIPTILFLTHWQRSSICPPPTTLTQIISKEPDQRAAGFFLSSPGG